MAISKKNVSVQVTFPKEDAEHLETLKTAFNKEGIKVSKSDILVRAFRDYLEMIIMSGLILNTEKEAKEDKKDA